MSPDKRVCYYLLPRCFQYPSDCSSYRILRCFRFFSATNDASQDPPPQTPSLVGYLVGSCGFSRGDAVKVSASLPHVKTSEKANAVVQFLKQKGLGEDSIRRAVLGLPRLLCFHLGKTLVPKVRILEEAGFSSSEIIQFVSTYPRFFRIAHLETKIDFWRKILGTGERILKVISESHVLNSSLDRKIKPNISILRDTGLAEYRVARIIYRRPRLISCRTDKIRALIDQVESLGISASSGMFEHAIYALANNSKTKFDAKMRAFKGFGWSEDDFFCALQRSAHPVRASEKKIQEVMGFLVGEVGLDPSYVALRPVLLSYSLKKRLMPRYSVLKNLKSQGLSAGQHDFLGVICLSEGSFMKKYVLPYKEKAPGLLEAYPMVIAK